VVVVLIIVGYVVVVAAMALLYLKNAEEVRLKKNRGVRRQVIHRQVTHRRDVLVIHLQDVPEEINRQIHIHQQQATLLQEDFPRQTRRKSRRRKRNRP
jgi:hypothetical protein